MQRSNGTTPAPAACASCKHQRKKCTEKCVLAPYFPAEKGREFQAVHKVFGVSNVTKMVRNVKEEERQRVAESLVWEAICRQNDPVLGPLGEYRRVYEELKMYKSQYEPASMVMGWDAENGRRICNTNTNTNTNSVHYIHSRSVNSMAGYTTTNSMNHHVQNFQNLRRDTENGSPAILPRQHPANGFNQQYFLGGQYNPADSSLWDGVS